MEGVVVLVLRVEAFDFGDDDVEFGAGVVDEQTAFVSVEEDEDILPVTKDTTFDQIFDHYFVYDDDYILTVEKDGKTARILQTWYGGVEGLYSNSSSHKDIYDDLDKVSEDWYDEMEEKEIQWD